MGMNLSIKNVPEDLVARLRERATRNHRSLQGELMSIIEGSVPERRYLTIEEVAEQARAKGFSTPSESADIIRADRDSR